MPIDRDLQNRGCVVDKSIKCRVVFDKGVVKSIFQHQSLILLESHAFEFTESGIIRE